MSIEGIYYQFGWCRYTSRILLVHSNENVQHLESIWNEKRIL